MYCLRAGAIQPRNDDDLHELHHGQCAGRDGSERVHGVPQRDVRRERCIDKLHVVCCGIGEQRGSDELHDLPRGEGTKLR